MNGTGSMWIEGYETSRGQYGHLLLCYIWFLVICKLHKSICGVCRKHGKCCILFANTRQYWVWFANKVVKMHANMPSFYPRTHTHRTWLPINPWSLLAWQIDLPSGEQHVQWYGLKEKISREAKEKINKISIFSYLIVSNINLTSIYWNWNLPFFRLFLH